MDIGFTISGCLTAAVAVVPRNQWRRPAAWLALALAGQAVALRPLDAGRLVHYQHLRDPRQVWGDPSARWLLIAVAAQTIFVALGLARHWAEIRAWVAPRFRVWQVAAILAFCCSLSAAVSRDPRFFLVELSFASALQLINLGNVVMVALTLPRLKLPGWFADRDTEPKIDG